MLFRNDKKLLRIIKSQEPGLPNLFYDWNDVFRVSGMNEKEYLISLRNLASENLISFPDNSMTTFRLEANGLCFAEYQIQKIKQYIMDKIVDFLALIVAIIALAVLLI